MLGPEERAERDSHANQAMDALRIVLAAGFATVAWISQDPDLELLRSRDDFRTLIMDLAFPADPFARANTTQ